jgi:tryptophan 7-halogenase
VRGEQPIKPADGQRLRHIAIVGGDLHAWCAAARLAVALRASGVRVSVLDNSPPEAPGILSTQPSIIDLHHRLGVREADLIRHIGAAYSYGYAYCNWAGDNATRVCSYGASGQMMDRIEFHHYVTLLRETCTEATMEAFSPAAVASREQRFSHPKLGSHLSQLTYAMQFDRIGYLSFLRAFALDHGVQRIAANVTCVELDAKTGGIGRLILEDGHSLSADFYFDSSGEAAMLIEGALASGFESWQKLFPCDRRLEIMHRSAAPTPLFNTVIQERNGWQQSSALPGAVYRTHSFCSASAEENEEVCFGQAQQSQQQSPDDSTSPHIRQQKAGVRCEFWKHNCVAIGESAGFAERFFFDPFHQTCTAIERWLELLPDHAISPHLQRQYNLATREEYDRIRDIHALPLMCARGVLSPFWQRLKSDAPWPESLKHRVELFQQTGKLAFYEADPVRPHQWIQWMTHFGVWPERSDPLIADFSAQELQHRMDRVAQAIKAEVSKMPRHDDLLAAIRNSHASKESSK